MTRSIFDPGGDAEHSGNSFRSPDAANNSRMPKDAVDGEVSAEEAADLGVAPNDPDALADAEFKNSLSVVNLRLTSVMCVPLLERGNVLGVIYVGNDNVALLFDESHLEVLTIFASQASLLIRNALLVNELQLDNRHQLSRWRLFLYG